MTAVDSGILWNVSGEEYRLALFDQKWLTGRRELLYNDVLNKIQSQTEKNNV